MISKTFALSTSIFLLSASYCHAAELLSGPMVGHTTTSSAKIWLETDQPSEVKVLYWQEPRVQYDKSLGQPMVKGEATVSTLKQPRTWARFN